MNERDEWGHSPLRIDILSFEGPDAYARAGGIASRIVGLARALAQRELQTHLWFVGAPDAPGEEIDEGVALHRWCQWLSAHHPQGVYDGEVAKAHDYATSLPPFLARAIAEHEGPCIVMAEEWHTVHAVLHLDWLLRKAGIRKRVRILWNANNTFGFDRIDWARLARAAQITTVSRYMRHALAARGVDALVLPNGVGPDAFEKIEGRAIRDARSLGASRMVLTKIARWDPDKQWLQAVDAVALLRARGRKPLLVARGGLEAHGYDVLSRALAHGLRVLRYAASPGEAGVLESLRAAKDTDVLILDRQLDAKARRLLLRVSDAVLAQSGHEPFGLVGLETMAAGGIAVTGCTGEDYASHGHDALVAQTADPSEHAALVERASLDPALSRALRRAGPQTARRYTWDHIVDRVLLPRFDLVR
jgi:glycosyltransferase involved in cell wall biosynthesis